MRAWQVHAWGEPEAMKFEDLPLPEPGPAQVRVRVRAAALNFFDILQIQGKYQYKPPFPFTPGAEVAGVVDACGPGVSGFSAGEPVLAIVPHGGYAEAALAPAGHCFPMPAGMDFPEAAAFPIVYQTSYFALVDRAALRPGEWLLVHAGASGVGMAAIHLGRALGARVIATAGSEAKLDFARAQGAHETLLYNEPSWPDRVKAITGGAGANVIFDPVGGDIFDLSSKCISSEGRLLVVGFASGRIPSIAANRILLKNISVVGAVWGGFVQVHPGYPAQAHAALLAWYSQGALRPAVSLRFPLPEAPAALAELAGRRVLGKAVLVV